MTALTADFNAPHAHKLRRSYFPVAASTTIYVGSMVGLLNGYLTPAANTAGIRVIGRADEQVDNSDGSAGDLTCEVSMGVFRWNNDTTDDVVAADVGLPCYVLDDNTVANVAGSAGVIAGIVERMDSDGVWVRTPDLAEFIYNSAIETVTTGAISVLTRSSLISVTGTVAYTLADGVFEGQRKSLRCSVAATTPDGTITPVTLNGGTTLDMDAVNESYELEWHAASGWNVIHLIGGAIA
jgi:hypothetical protein